MCSVCHGRGRRHFLGLPVLTGRRLAHPECRGLTCAMPPRFPFDQYDEKRLPRKRALRRNRCENSCGPVPTCLPAFSTEGVDVPQPDESMTPPATVELETSEVPGTYIADVAGVQNAQSCPSEDGSTRLATASA